MRLARTLIVFLCAIALGTSTALATDFTVSKVADTADGACNADCSLREAIIAANAAAGADKVILSATTYTLTLGPADAPGAQVAATGDLDVTGALTIEGNGAIVDAASLDRVLDIQGAISVTINNLTIRNGSAAGFLSLGGGIYIKGSTVALNNSTVTLNRTAIESDARDDGGGIAVIGSYDASTGVATLANLTLTDTSVSSNTGAQGGGILCVLCSFVTTRAAIDANSASGDGGGISVVGNSSTISITSSTLRTNTASGGTSRGGSLSVPFGTGTTIITRSTIVANTAGTGSALFNNTGSVTATNNWWGCNFGPGAGGAGCSGAPNGVSGSATVSPHLVLKTTPAPAGVLPNGASTVTADLTFNSSNVDTSAGGTIRNGLSVSFSGTLGTFATPTAPTSNGKATDIYTAGGATGTASVSATVDAQTISASIVIAYVPPVVITGTATAVTGATATLNGTANPGGSSTTGKFQYGLTLAYGTSTSDQALGSGNAPVAIGGGGLTGLDCNKAYHFRAVGTNPGGTVNGADATFTTTKCAIWDFDGEGKSDRAVYRPANGTWYLSLSGGGARATPWGAAGDVDVSADYDGDGKSDLAVWRSSTGGWYVVQSSNGSVVVTFWGTSGDIPAPGDVDGDKKADLIVWRPGTGAWLIRKSGGGITILNWGTSGDQPVLGDFDHDGKMDPTVFRPGNGVWYSSLSAGGTRATAWGMNGDIPMPGLFDGDAQSDLAVFRPSTGAWFVSKSLTATTTTVTWGMSGDVPVSGDEDGDGLNDFIVWRPATGIWFGKFSGGATATVIWGTSGDKPIGHQF